MGYTTDFSGQLTIEPAIKDEHAKYINQFSNTRRVKRDEFKAVNLPDPIRKAVRLPVGAEGCYFVGGGGHLGVEKDESITAYNGPPTGQPSLWCSWGVEFGFLEWNGREKFYNYTEWLEYLIAHFLGPWGYKLNGQIRWFGEDSNDQGTIFVKDNMVEAVSAQIIQPQPSWGQGS